MSEISLKAYFGKLNTLLSAHAADEVIHHSRHILQSYPKNVTAYRFLGRALVLNGRWDEGRETLRRVLSVYPDDYVAHLGLSEANEHLNRPDEAIWHLERAYEQNTNNKEIIEALRGLYRRYRSVENLKIQLTAAAVARQNMRSGNYTQAIDTLRSARARMNDRLDLKLLLAQILWDQGSQEESAEIAVEVLKVLPDCLEANRIMAKLWLSLGLPSDAQRYVNHLENVDPYLAVEVVQGTPSDDDAFRLEELDYVHTSQSEMANARPDWLQEISASPAPVVDNAREIERDDWSSWTSALIGNQSPAPAEMPLDDEAIPDEQPMSARFAAMSHTSEPVIHTEGLTDLFGAVDDAPADELASLFEAPQPSPSTDSLDYQDPMAWLRDAGIETVDEEDEEPSFESLFSEDDNSPLPQMDANPMAWLEGSNSDLIIERDEPVRRQADDEPVFGWMQDDNLSDSLGAQAPAAQAAHSGTNDESLDWLQDDHLLDEALSLEGHLSGDPGVSQNHDDFSAFDASILDGQDDMLDQNEALTADKAEPESVVPGARRGLTAILSEANLDWMKEAQPEEVSGSNEMDDWLNQFGPAQPRPTPTDTPDWLTDLEQTETAAPNEDEWLNPDEAGRATIMGQANVDSFARMSGDSNNDADNFEEDDDDDSDWLAEFAPEEEIEDEPEASDEPEPDWLSATASGEAAPLAEAPVDTGALPDWLTQMVPGGAQDDAPLPAAGQPDSEFNWTPAAPAEETALSDWLSELSPQDEAEAVSGETADSEFSWAADALLDEEASEAEPVAAEETDWLSQLESTSEPSDPASTSADPDYPWMQAEEAAEREAQPEAEVENLTDTGALPEWLSELETASANAQAAVEAEYTWMGENAAEEVEAAVPAASEDMDWLSALAPETEAGPEAATAVSTTGEEDYTWMNEEALAEAEAVAETVGGEDADWLSELAPIGEQPTAETEATPAPVASDDMSWLSELQPENEAELEAEVVAAPVASDDMSWLSELQPGSEMEVAAEAVASEDTDWLSELQPESEAELETEAVAEPVASEEMSWLSELESEGEAEFEIEAEADAAPVAANDIGWLAELEPETEVAAVSETGEEDYTWMGQEETSEPAEAVAELVTSEDTDWLSELQSEGESETEADSVAEPVASDDISWLSELQPENEMPTEAEPVAAGDDELAWMAADDVSDDGMDEDAGELAAESAAEVASGLPNWLTELQPESDAVAETEPAAEEDLAWLAADEVADDEEAEEPMPVMDAEAVAEEFGDDEFEQDDDQFAPVAAEHETVLEPTPAHNAPDWLNAMVPGLDVDYEADDAEWVDDEEAAFDSSEREYAWVEQMVEEEMAAVEYSGYSFTSPPTWLASLGAPPQGGGADDDLPDWISDDADTDVPSWLR